MVVTYATHAKNRLKQGREPYSEFLKIVGQILLSVLSQILLIDGGETLLNFNIKGD